ncbi:MAG TPA: hypothetical protein PLZ51_11935 [Aggregatilineales bacterium]|nr:hypothetical protein [Aggregatilineales bacterium]
MNQCPHPHCGGRLMPLEKKRTLEMSVMKITRIYICMRCRRIHTSTAIYMRVYGVLLNAEASVTKGGGL